MSVCTIYSLILLFWTLLAWRVLGLEGIQSGSQMLQALHCPPCERIHCSPRRAMRLQCKGGITTGICGCCPACAKVAGESCGGKWDYLGKCDDGLVCVYPDPAGSQSDTELKGTCKSVFDIRTSSTCRPECTWELCQSNPKAICSARSVSLEKHECQGHCQHTSCSSCLVLRPPSCTHTCAPTDEVCLHHFGSCVHKHLTEKHRSPVCHQNLQQSNTDGYFVCMVPGCPDTVK